VQEAERQRRAARVLQEQASRPPAGNSPGNRAGQPSKESRCKYLDELVQRLDAEARQPRSAQRQDRIRVRRKAARDEQFALRC
jgi:hypothetical protein